MMCIDLVTPALAAMQKKEKEYQEFLSNIQTNNIPAEQRGVTELRRTTDINTASFD